MKNSQNCTRVDIFRLSSAQINHNISEIQTVGLEIETKKEKKWYYCTMSSFPVLRHIKSSMKYN